MSKKENKTIYVHEIVTLWSDNGEVYAQTDNDDVIVFHGENLFNDIPTLMTLALKERRNQENITLELIASELDKRNEIIKT